MRDEEEHQRKRAIAAERTVKELSASLADLRAREIELLDGKVRSTKLTVAFSQSSYTLMTHRVVGTRLPSSMRGSPPSRCVFPNLR